MTRILIVTGGREYYHRGYIFDWLDDTQPDMVIHGGAAGADDLADEWAMLNSVPRVIFGVASGGKRGWNARGRAAGPARNGDIIEFCRLLQGSDLLGNPNWDMEPRITGWALPGRSGTRDMVKRIKSEGIYLHDHRFLEKALKGTVYEYEVQG